MYLMPRPLAPHRGASVHPGPRHPSQPRISRQARSAAVPAADGGPPRRAPQPRQRSRRLPRETPASSDPGRLLRRQVGGAAHVDEGRPAARRAGALHPHRGGAQPGNRGGACAARLPAAQSRVNCAADGIRAPSPCSSALTQPSVSTACSRRWCRRCPDDGDDDAAVDVMLLSM